jgi:ubiquitin C-terminal hydrolase
MFGLRNIAGSCWVNATLQSVFRIPALQERYDALDADALNAVDNALQKIWSTHGGGLDEFFETVRSEDMPAGRGIGDSHELLLALCDKLPWLDKELRFGFGTKVSCKHCDYTNLVRESVLEFPVMPTESCKTLADSIQSSVRVFEDPGWTCEKCKETGCTQQHLLAELPNILVFHRRNLENTFQYPSILVLNKQKFALFSVVCYNGGHWWTIARDLPPGKPWVTYDDSDVRKHDPNHFPLASNMRLLFYARINS